MTELSLLLIEDTDDDAELIVAELRRAGYDFRVTRETTAAGVQEAIERQPFDLVLSDYRMPGFNGAEALALVRARDLTVPFLIVSGTIGEEAAVDVIRGGANDYVMKGKLSRLGAAVARELHRVSLERERTALERELARARENLTRSIEIAPVGICHVTPTGHFTMVNATCCEILGYSAEELATMSFEDITHPEDLEASRAARNAMARDGIDQVKFEKRYLRKDGTDVWASVSSAAIRDVQGKADYFFTVISDISARRAAQEELRRRARQQEAIALFGQMVVSGCSLEMLYEEMTERLAVVLEADVCDVFQLAGADTLRLVAAHGWPEGAVGHVVVSLLDDSHVVSAVESGLPLLVDIPSPEAAAEPRLHAAMGMKTGLIVPVGGGIEGPVAAIGVYSRRANRFAREDEDFLTACANLTAHAIERRKAEETLWQHARRQTALAELAGRLLRAPLNATIPVCDLLTDALDVEYAAFITVDEQMEWGMIAEGATWIGGSGARFRLEGTQAAYTLRAGTAVVVTDYETEQRFDGDPYYRLHGLRSGVSITVRGDKLFGIIKVATRAARDFRTESLLFLQSLSDLLTEGLERRSAQHELNVSRERYRNVLDGAAEIIVSLCPTGRIQSVNREFEQSTGWTAAEWIGRPYVELFVEQDREAAREIFIAGPADARPTGRPFRIRPRTGEDRDVELSAVALQENGRVVEIFVFGRDVTERRRIEEAKGRLADELSLLLDSVAEGIFRFDLDGRCTMMNRAAADVLGAHTPLQDFSVQAIERPDDGIPRIVAAIAAGNSFHANGGVFCTADGKRVPVDFSASPLVENGAVVGGVVCFSDISIRRQLESQLEKERRLNSLGRLAASMAHEFNNVLMAISPFAEILSRKVGPSDTSALNATEQIRRGVGRGKRITEEILRFANPTPPALTTFAARPWLQGLAEEVRPLLGGKVHLTVEADAELQLAADAPQLAQVAQNLILNARDAMPSGGRITFSARRATPAERDRFDLPSGEAEYVHISVADTGTGIPREQLDQIFEPLFTTKRSGTGLGLPISRQIVKKHDGHMFVESTANVGTVFHIFLPHVAVVAGREAAAAVDPAAVAGMTLLLVEDDPHVAAGLRLALEERGIVVHHVATGNGALRALADFTLDAAIIDVGLPDIDGTRVFEEGAKGRRIPVVFSTGHADHSKISPYLTDTHVAHLLKPYSIDSLLRSLVTVTAVPTPTGK
ncbi:MAG TPA: PAS domain S-box protein [Thermoanaerobaculia bacterium]|jgi:PAS domain S-box-containing protein